MRTVHESQIPKLRRVGADHVYACEHLDPELRWVRGALTFQPTERGSSIEARSIMLCGACSYRVADALLRELEGKS